jgi:dTDP-4-dehydrorhamnose 3,5-epimerase
MEDLGLMSFIIKEKSISDIKIITRNEIGDKRGYLSRVFCSDELIAVGWNQKISQINLTFTKDKGTVRGLHYQEPPFEEKKIVNCLEGQIFDVAVDMRPDSDTYLQWTAEILSKDNMNALFIPEGFAHGFQALTENVKMLYFHSKPYAPAYEKGINVMDPKLRINWPLEVSTISDRDKEFPFLN